MAFKTFDDRRILATIDEFYPVGSIYLSVSPIVPENLFDVGEWKPIKDLFLLGASATYPAGSIGGEAEHTLTVNELPSHRHKYSYWSTPSESSKYGEATGSDSKTRPTGGRSNSNMGYFGGGQAHNNMPPYITVYGWERIA